VPTHTDYPAGDNHRAGWEERKCIPEWEVQGAPGATVRGGPGEVLPMTTATFRLPEHRELRKDGEWIFTLRKRAGGSSQPHWEGEPATPLDVEEGLAEVLAFAAEVAGLPVPQYTLQPETLLDYDLAWAILQATDEVHILLAFAPTAVKLSPKSMKEKGKTLAQNLLDVAATYLTADFKRQKPPAFEAAVLVLRKFVAEVLADIYGGQRLDSLRSGERQFWSEFRVSR
jgi:hypothetical protein